MAEICGSIIERGYSKRGYILCIGNSNYGHFHTTVFNKKWKFVQSISSSLLEIKVENKLFNIANDPYEYQDLASQEPNLVTEMAEKIRNWRALHPIAELEPSVPPPGWRAPKDWSTYTIPKDNYK